MQVAETVPEGVDHLNYITYIDVNDATDHDVSTIASFITDQDVKDIIPSEIYADTHYNSVENIEELAEQTIDL